MSDEACRDESQAIESEIPEDNPYPCLRFSAMTAKQFYDWQTAGGTDDVMRLVDCLERADIAWCAIGGVAVNHWAQNPW